MKKIGMLFVALACSIAPAQVQAQRSEVYLGVAGGAVWTDAATSVAKLSPGTMHDEQIPNGLKIYGGRMWDRVGVEFGYYNLGKFDIIDAGGAVQDQMKTFAFAVSGVYTGQIGQGYVFNAKLGVAFTHTDYDCRVGCGASPFIDTRQRGTSGLIGVGVGWQPSGGVMWRMDFEHIGSVQHAMGNTVKFKDGYDMFSVGVQLQF